MMEYKQTIIRTTLLALAIIVTITSCMDDRYDFRKISDEIEINPGLSAPVAFGSFTIADILNEYDESGYVNEDEDNLLYLTYSEKLLSFRASDVIDIPNQSFLEFYFDSEIGSSFGIPFGVPIPSGLTIQLNKRKDGEFVFLNNERVDSIFLKNTILRIQVNSSYHHTGTLNIISPNVVINGEPFSETVLISDPSGNFSYSLDIPLEGSKITLDNTNPDTTFLPLFFELELVSSGAAINTGDQCDIVMSFINLDFYSIYGYLGDHEVLYDAGGVNVELFDSQFGEGNVYFFDPKVRLEVNNSYGLPVSVELQDVFSTSEINNVTTPIVFSGVNPFLIDAPQIVGSSVRTDINIDRSNCNIREAMDSQPNEFYFKAKAISNPDGLGVRNNFATDSSQFDVDFMVVLPLWLRAEGYSLNDTVEFDMEDQFGDYLKFIKYLRVTLNATNGLPMNADLQVYFTDENFSVIDSMFIESEMFLEPALINNDDQVSTATSMERKSEFTEGKLERIKETKHAIVKATVSTARSVENRYVKFMSDYKIDFKLSLKADFTINSRDL